MEKGTVKILMVDNTPLKQVGIPIFFSPARLLRRPRVRKSQEIEQIVINTLARKKKLQVFGATAHPEHRDFINKDKCASLLLGVGPAAEAHLSFLICRCEVKFDIDQAEKWDHYLFSLVGLAHHLRVSPPQSNGPLVF